jgi:DNA replication protein DnaC
VVWESWVDVCQEAEGGTLGSCRGYLMYHYGPEGKWSEKKMCSAHGGRWQQDPRSPIEIKQEAERRLKMAGIPQAYQNFTMATYPSKDQPHYRECQEYAAQGKLQSAVLGGRFGTGKTGLAISVMRERIEHHQEHGLFVVVPSLFAEMRSAMDTDNKSDLLRQVKQMPGLLVLDDMGAERATPWVQEQLYDVINTRLLHNRPTIITTNLNLVELEDQLGKRTMERIKAYRQILVGGDNLRDR